MKEKEQFLGLIKSNVAEYGYHLNIVSSEIEPRYAYSVGLKDIFGYELIFAGGIYYLKEELYKIFEAIVGTLKISKNMGSKIIDIKSMGRFSLCKVDPTWSELMLLGVFDYYKTNVVEAYQIIPESENFTLDIPDMTEEYNAFLEPVWRWLSQEWDYPVSSTCTVITNINALRGEPVTEIMRWEDNEWEMFAGAGPDVQQSDIRVVSLGTMLGIDKSLVDALYLAKGTGLWREAVNSDWQNWN